MTEIRVPRHLSTLAMNIFRTLGASLQFARPLRAATRYTMAEYDSTGRYIAEYEAVGDQNHWRKRKQRYSELFAAKTAVTPPVQVVPKVTSSEGEIQLDAELRPVVISLREEVQIAGAQVPVQARTTVLLESRSVNKIDQPIGEVAGDFETVAADAPYGAAAPVETLDDARIHGLTIDTVLSQLEQSASVRGASAGAPASLPNERDQHDVEANARLFGALSALLRKDPANIERAVAKVRARSPESLRL